MRVLCKVHRFRLRSSTLRQTTFNNDKEVLSIPRICENYSLERWCVLQNSHRQLDHYIRHAVHHSHLSLTTTTTESYQIILMKQIETKHTSLLIAALSSKASFVVNSFASASSSSSNSSGWYRAKTIPNSIKPIETSNRPNKKSQKRKPGAPIPAALLTIVLLFVSKKRNLS